MPCRECSSDGNWQLGRTFRCFWICTATIILATIGGLVYCNRPIVKTWHPDKAMEETFAAIRDDRIAHWTGCREGGECDTCKTLAQAEADATRARTEFIRSYRFRRYDKISDDGGNGVDSDR